MCNCQVIEDEYHFIIECHLYNDLRKKYISKYFWIRPSMFKFVELINSTNQNCIRKLGAFIYQATNRIVILIGLSPSPEGQSR